MSEGTQINKTELQEMARVLLCEIYSERKLQSGRNELDYSTSVSQMVSRAESGYVEFDRRSLGRDNEDSIKRKPSGFGEIAESSPRLNRREFFEQRLQRRRQRQAQYENFESASAPAENYIVKSSDNLAALDLSEKISDNFCRDARRYDGAFERY